MGSVFVGKRGRDQAGSGGNSGSPTVTPSRRIQVVWGSLLASRTLVAGLLYGLDRSPAPRLEGVSLPALMAPGGGASIETVFGTRRTLDKARWQAIVIHHSDSPSGKPSSLDGAARANGLKELGYHFVVGNGNGMADGELFVGRRWRDQAPGAHVAGPNGAWFNEHAVGICLVGDGDRGNPSPAQLERLEELAASLCRRLNIPKERVYLHSELARTTSPGKLFPATAFREELAARL